MAGSCHKSKHIAALAAVFLLLGACIRNEIKVGFSLPQKVNEAYKLVYYASDPVKGWFTETVVAVQQGKARHTLYTRNPSIVFIMDAGSLPRAAFYAERGDNIKITGDSGNPLSWTISGNKLTEEWSAWRASARDALSSSDPARINKAVSAYILKNPDNPLSTLLLLIYFDRREDETGFHRLWSSLKGKALEPKWIQMVGRADMLGDSPSVTRKTASIILHSSGNGVDTLGIGEKPVLLYFWREDDPHRDESIGIVKKLAASLPDSASRIMADICFDPDSVRWMAKARRDSVAGVVRGWNFKAETDSVMRRLGVTRTPWFIVFDKKGNERYAGEDETRADKVFRKINNL